MTIPPESLVLSAPGAVASSVRHRRAVLLLVSAGLFMTTLDTSIVNIGLPSIAHAFGVPVSGTIEWVIIAYLVAIAGLLLTFGRLSDMVGRTTIWTAGLMVFTLGSAFCGAAPSLELLIAGRAVQGIGSALLLSTSNAILTDAFPASERGRALGWSAVAFALGTSTGPTLGGLITEHLGWRWIFYVNVPVGLGALIATRRTLAGGLKRARGRLDPAGALLLGVGVAALNLGLSLGESWGWSSPRLLGTLGLAVAALSAAVYTERRVPAPIVDLSLFRSRAFVSAIVSAVFSLLALFAVSFLLPFYFEELRGFSTAHSGLLLTPLPLAIGALDPLAGSLADRLGSRWLAPSGLAIVALGLILLSRLDATSPTWDVAWRLALIGIGQGLFLAPNARALMGAAPETRQGAASGLLATARVTGQALSVAIAGAVFTGLGAAAAGSKLVQLRAQGGGGEAELAMVQTTFVHGMRAALCVCAGFAALGALVALMRDSER